jgi:hypothetical protein
MVGIHHAQGLPKKLSIDYDAPSVDSLYFGVQWDVGQVHGGSSGSPLFSDRKRVVGQACCVTNFDCGSQITFYSRFGKFFSTKSLAQWLDPLGLGVPGIDGYDPYQPQVFAYYGSGSNADVYTATSPAIGASWTGTVDVSGHPGATGTLLLGRAGRSSGTFVAAGELLIDFASPFVFQDSAGVVAGSSVHSATIPNDPGLAGAVAYTQAAILGGGIELTNGVKLRLN